MLPTVFTIPWINYDIPGYGLMLMIGFLLTTAWATSRAARSGANPDVILNCAFIALIAGVAGGRLMYVLHNPSEFLLRGSATAVFWAIVDVRKGGLEVYGGVILATLVAIGYLRLWRHSVRWYLDIIAPSLALGMAIGRLGCLLNGCCWGGVCEAPWAVQFPYGSGPALQHWQERRPEAALPAELLAYNPAGQALPIPRESLHKIEATLAAEQRLREHLAAATARLDAASTPTERAAATQARDKAAAALRASQQQYPEVRAAMSTFGRSAAELRALAARQHSAPVHPTQFYSFITLALLAALLSALYWRRSHDGEVICLFFILEPIARWLLEVIRADNPLDTFGSRFTISQGIAMTLLTLALIGFFVVHRLPPRSPRARIWTPDEPTPAAAR